MDGIPPALPTDSEDVVWALQTADSLWKRGERLDAVVWLRRAAQAAGDGDDAKRAALLARRAAELTDGLKRFKPPAAKTPAKKAPPGMRTQSLEELDRMFGDPSIAKRASAPKVKNAPAVPPSAESSGSIDVEVVSANDFEAGFRAPSVPAGRYPSEGEVMTISMNAPDVELIEEDAEPAYARSPTLEDDVQSIDDEAESLDDEDDTRSHTVDEDIHTIDDGAAIVIEDDASATVDDEAASMLEDASSAIGEFHDEDPTPVRMGHKSPMPPRAPSDVPSAAQAHAGMLDPWSDEGRASRVGAPPGRKSRFDEEEVVTSARRPAQAPPAAAGSPDEFPPAPRAPRIPPPSQRRAAPRDEPPAPPAEETDDTTYRQVQPRSKPRRPLKSDPDAETPVSSRQIEQVPPRAESKAPPRPPAKAPPRAESKAPPRPGAPRAPSGAPKPPRPPPVSAKPPPRVPAKPAPSVEPPTNDLLDLANSIQPAPLEPTPSVPAAGPTAAAPAAPRTFSVPSPTEDEVLAAIAPLKSFRPALPNPSAVPTPRPGTTGSLPVSARPTAPPPSSATFPSEASPSSPPTRPRAGSTLLDLSAVEALSDLPDDAREAFAASAKIHAIAIEEEVAGFALALVVDGAIDVSSTIVDAPALKLERNAILRSRGTLERGVDLRLVCSTPKARVATWDDDAVADAFRTCPWVEDDLRAVADRVQAKVGLTMGPLGERWDLSLREHLIEKLTLRPLAAGETLVAQGKPVPLAIVGVGELVVTQGAKRTTLRPGDFVFAQQILAHASAPGAVVAGSGGALVFYGDRAVTQELLMGFPPILELLATI